MPNAVGNDFHINGFLSNLLHGYRPQGFVADQLFPVVRVGKQSNVFGKIDRGNWFRIPVTLRAPRSKAREVGYEVSSDTYFARNYELMGVADWETIENADNPHDPLGQTALLVADGLLLDFEDRVMSRVLSGVGSSATLTGVNAWNDFTNSDPLNDWDVAINAIQDTTGKRPNVMVVARKAWQKIRRHPDVVRVIYPGAGVGGTVSPEQLGNYLGIPKILVPEVIKNTAAEIPGQQDSGTFTDVWSTFCILAHVAAAPGIFVPSFGYAFRWGGERIGNQGPTDFTVEQREDPARKVTELRAGYYQDEKIVARELGYLINTGIT